MKNVFEHIARASKYSNSVGAGAPTSNHSSMVAVAKMMVKESSALRNQTKLKTKPKRLGYFPY